MRIHLLLVCELLDRYIRYMIGKSLPGPLPANLDVDEIAQTPSDAMLRHSRARRIGRTVCWLSHNQARCINIVSQKILNCGYAKRYHSPNQFWHSTRYTMGYSAFELDRSIWGDVTTEIQAGKGTAQRPEESRVCELVRVQMYVPSYILVWS